jgi:hypothetical protein
MGEIAVLTVIARQVMREAQRLGLISVKERRIPGQCPLLGTGHHGRALRYVWNVS